MNFNDFSSLVQLGVGLHLGTALLQSVGEIGLRPLHRTVSRLRGLIASGASISDSTREGLDDLEGDMAIFEVQMFKEFRKYVVINTAVGLILIGLLMLIAFKASDPISIFWAIIISLLASLPAIATLLVFWIDSFTKYKPLMKAAGCLEEIALREAVEGSRD